jgi:hypothetical protein
VARGLRAASTYRSTRRATCAGHGQRVVDGSKAWLDIDYTSGEGLTLFKYDVLTQGPVLGFGFRF